MAKLKSKDEEYLSIDEKLGIQIKINIMKYKTIQAEGVTKFNLQCNEMIDNGYSPAFNVCMILINPNSEMPIILYSQQWMIVEKD